MRINDLLTYAGSSWHSKALSSIIKINKIKFKIVEGLINIYLLVLFYINLNIQYDNTHFL